MASNPAGQYPIAARSRDVVIASFSFSPNGTNDPDNVRDPSNLLASLTYQSTGLYRATLNDRYSRIFIVGVERCDSTVDEMARPRTPLDGLSAANYVEVQMLTPSTGSAVNDTAGHIHVTLALHRKTVASA